MRFCAASDRALLVYLGEEIGLPAHYCVLKLLRALQKKPPVWLRNVQPAYCSLLITFDPCSVDHTEVEAVVHRYAARGESMHPPKPRTVEIPVCYDEEYGPDLEAIATLHNLSAQEVVRLHSASTYHAYFLGFAPGFAYLGDLPEAIATPRLEIPRKQVPAGSVGIAGRQTAVYPFASPGGWRLLGRTPLRLFKTQHEPMPLLSIGDKVRFRPISRAEFQRQAEA